MKPLEIIANEGENKRQFPTLVNLADTEMIEFYKGALSGNAIVDKVNEEVVGFLYHNDDDDSIFSSLNETIEEVELLKGFDVVSCDFSGTQILFNRK